MRLLKCELTKKGLLKLDYRQTEVGVNGVDDAAIATIKKTSDKVVHRHLSNAFSRFIPHLLFQTELVDHKVAIPESLSAEEWFTGLHFDDDDRFEGVQVTRIDTFGKDSIEGIRIIGYKENSKGDICPLKSGVIYFDREDPEHYALNHLVQASLETLEFECEEWEKGKNANTITNQLSFFEDK